jgi:hypothetical protein
MVTAATGRFFVRKPDVASGAFVVVDADGGVVPEAAEFCRWLVAVDRSAYTQRAYALGLAHFFDWLAETDRSLVEVERPVIAAYIADFRAGGRRARRGLMSHGSDRWTRARESLRRDWSASRRRSTTACLCWRISSRS